MVKKNENSKVKDRKSIAEISAMEIDVLSEWVEGLSDRLTKREQFIANEILKEIKSSSESIKKAVSKIDEKCEHITKSYINEIEKKIDKFELELGKKIIKKID